MSNKPPKIVIPGLNRGAGVQGGYTLGRRRGTGQGPAELLDINQIQGQGIGRIAHTNQVNSTTASTAESQTTSLSTSNSTSLSQISSSLSGAISTNVNQSTSLSQVSSSLSGAISSTTSLSTAVSTVISGSISVVNSRIDSLSTAVGGGGTIAVQDEGVPKLTASTLNFKGAGVVAADDGGGVAGITITGGGGPDPGQSTSLSQISSSLSGAISSTSSLSTAVSSSLSSGVSATTSLSTAVSTVISGSISTVTSSITSLSTAVSTVDSNQSSSISVNLSKINSLSTAIGPGGGGWTELLYYDFSGGGAASSKECDVTGYKDIEVICNGLVHAASVQRCLNFSIDAGSNWYTTSGDYQDVSVAGVGANNVAIFMHGTPTTAARDCACHIWDNDGRIPIVVDVITRSTEQRFLASATAINRIRLVGVAANVVSGSNFTSGFFRVRART